MNNKTIIPKISAILSINAKKMLKRIKNKFFGDLSTDIALRYLPIIDLIKKYRLENDNILEIGSGDLGITPYLKKKVLGLDISFSGKNNEYLNKIIYKGGKIPFKNNEFDLVISVDCLEHIPKENRQETITEMVRVCRKNIILIFPCGEASYEHDKRISEYYRKIYKKEDKYLSEHLRCGLPEKEEIIKILNNSQINTDKQISVIASGKLTNLKLRSVLMKFKIGENGLLKIVYFLFLLLLPFRRLFNFGKCYRRFFLIAVR